MPVLGAQQSTGCHKVLDARASAEEIERLAKHKARDNRAFSVPEI
jgi:hypothetical protein